MARIRNVKPEFYDDYELAESVSRDGRYLYKAMWLWMDRQGIGIGAAPYWRAKVFPYDTDVTVSDVQGWIDELIAAGRLFRVTYEGKEYLYCPTMSEHQKFHKEEKPKYLIPKEILNDAANGRCEPPTSTPPKMINADTSSAEIGNLKSEAGVAETEVEPTPPPTDCQKFENGFSSLAQDIRRWIQAHQYTSLKRHVGTIACHFETREAFDDWLHGLGPPENATPARQKKYIQTAILRETGVISIANRSLQRVN